MLRRVEAEREMAHIGVHLQLGQSAVDSLLGLALGHLRLDAGGRENEVVLLALAVAHLRGDNQGTYTLQRPPGAITREHMR